MKAQSIMEINRAYYNPKAKSALGNYSTMPKKPLKTAKVDKNVSQFAHALRHMKKYYDF